MWTDADAIINAQDVAIEDWEKQNPTADVYWSLDDPGPASRWVTLKKFSVPLHKNNKQLGWCSSQPDGVAGFASCLNTGVFIMRNNDWTQAWLQRILDLSTKSIAEGCSTGSFNPDHFDQCAAQPKDEQQRHVGDQCVITCDASRHADALSHYHSFRPDHVPRFQYVLFAMFRLPLSLTHRRPPNITRDTFVVNCAGHINEAQFMDCVRYASDLSDAYMSQ